MRGFVAVRLVKAIPFTVDFNVPKYCAFCVFAGFEVFVVKPLLFEFAPKALHRGVVVTVAFSAH